jgi:hypothetical protein
MQNKSTLSDHYIVDWYRCFGNYEISTTSFNLSPIGTFQATG